MSETERVELLVVDDSSFNRLLLKRRLGELGYDRIQMATNGREALAAMAEQSFDVVLMRHRGIDQRRAVPRASARHAESANGSRAEWG